MTREQAKTLYDAYEISDLLNNDEYMKDLEISKPALAEAFYALHRLAFASETIRTPGVIYDHALILARCTHGIAIGQFCDECLKSGDVQIVKG